MITAIAFVIFMQIVTFGLIIFQSIKIKKIMDAQNRLNAAQETTAAAITEIGNDLTEFIEAVKNNTVTEALIARAEAQAAQLTSLGQLNDVGEGDEG